MKDTSHLRARGASRPLPSRRPRPADDTAVRDEILAATRKVIQRHGFRKTTMDDIAQAMGRERSSLYYYFSDRTELMKAYVEAELLGISRAVRAEVARQTDPVSRLGTYVLCLVDQIATRVSFYIETVPDLSRDRSLIFEAAAQRQAFDEDEQRFLAELILEGVRSQRFRTLSQAEVMLFTRFSFLAIRGIALQHLFEPTQPTDLKSQFQVALEIQFRGLLRPDG